MSALMRNLGGSVGISFVTTLLERLTQQHLSIHQFAKHHRPCRPLIDNDGQNKRLPRITDSDGDERS